jgi:hypothetical protein
MLGILTNDTDNPISFDNLAFVTDRLYTSTDFHLSISSIPFAIVIKNAGKHPLDPILASPSIRATASFLYPINSAPEAGPAG